MCSYKKGLYMLFVTFQGPEPMPGSLCDPAIAAGPGPAIDEMQKNPRGQMGNRMRKFFDIAEVLPMPDRIGVWLLS